MKLFWELVGYAGMFLANFSPVPTLWAYYTGGIFDLPSLDFICILSGSLALLLMRSIAVKDLLTTIHFSAGTLLNGFLLIITIIERSK